MELVTKRLYENDNTEWVNELTTELNKHVRKEHASSLLYGGSYLYGFPENKRLSIRFPGATRGGISFDDNNIITEVRIYEDSYNGCVQCYLPSVKNSIDKFIGTKLIFSEEVEENKNE